MGQKEQVINQLMKYLQRASDWDVYEVAEWTFGYDEPLVEKYRDEILKNESKRIDPPTTTVQSKL
jgi:hypothetical protein